MITNRSMHRKPEYATLERRLTEETEQCSKWCVRATRAEHRSARLAKEVRKLEQRPSAVTVRSGLGFGAGREFRIDFDTNPLRISLIISDSQMSYEDKERLIDMASRRLDQLLQAAASDARHQIARELVRCTMACNAIDKTFEEGGE